MEMEYVTIKMTRDERDYILEKLLWVATHGDTNSSERLDVLDAIVSLMKEAKGL